MKTKGHWKKNCMGAGEALPTVGAHHFFGPEIGDRVFLGFFVKSEVFKMSGILG